MMPTVQPAALVWTAEVRDPTHGDATIGYSSIGVWCIRHGAQGVAGYIARTHPQLCRVTQRHPHLADALCIAWDLYRRARSEVAHVESTPVRVSARPNMETL